MNLRHKSRLSGLKALESLCDNESFIKRSDLGDYIEMIIPSVLLNMADTRGSEYDITKAKVSCPQEMESRASSDSAFEGKHGQMESQKSDEHVPTPFERRMSIQDQLITDGELKKISIHCLSALFSGASAASLKIILAPVLKYFYLTSGNWMRRNIGQIHIILLNSLQSLSMQSSPNTDTL